MENSLGSNRNTIPEVYAGANNKQNKELQKASQQKYTIQEFKFKNINFGKNKNYGQTDLLNLNKNNKLY